MAITDPPADPPPRATVIIPHRDDLLRLQLCLAALLAQPEVGQVEILVIDNASAVPPDALAAAFPQVRFLFEPQPGAACARNRGIAASRAPLLAFTDADCLPAPDWLHGVLGAGDSDAVIAGDVRLFRNGGGAAEAVDLALGFDIRRYVGKLGFGVTANLLIPRAVFDAVGGFRPGLPEDRDWCERAARAGYPLRFAPHLVVHHPCRESGADLRRKWHRITREGFARHCDREGRGLNSRLRWAAMGGAQIALGLRDAARLLRAGHLTGWRARCGGAVLVIALRGAKARWMLVQAAGRPW